MRIAAPVVCLLLASEVCLGAELQSTLQSKYDAMAKAFERKDDSFFDKLLGPKFVLVGTNGSKIDRKTILADFKHQMEAMTGGSWTRKVDRCVQKGSTATANISSHLTGPVMQHGVRHVFEMRATNRDTWQRTSNGWMIVKTQVLTLDATLDGKPVRVG